MIGDLLRREGTKIALFAAIVATGHLIAYKLVHVPRQLEFVILLSAILFYPVLKKPVVGIFAVFALSPFIPFMRRVYYLAYQRPSVDPIIALGDIFLIFTCLGLLFAIKDLLQQSSYGARFSWILLGYFFYMILRTFVYNYLPLGEALAKFKYYGPPVLFFLVGVLFAKEDKILTRLWGMTILIGIVSALYGMRQLYHGYSEAEKLWFASIEFTTLFIGGMPRPFSFFQAPVVLADYCQVAIIGVLMMVAWTKGRQKLLLLILIPVLFYAALITSVRTSWIGIILTFPIWYIFFRLKGNRNRILVMVVFGMLFVGTQLVVDSFDTGLSIDAMTSMLGESVGQRQNIDMLITNRLSALYNPLEEYSFISRMMLWRDLIIYSKDLQYAFLGRGLGTLSADSLYITYLAEFGYPGVIFICWLLAIFVLRGLYIIDNAPSVFDRFLAQGITAMNIVFAIIGVTGTHIHYFPGDIYFWFFNGVMMHRYGLLTAPNAPEGTGDDDP